MPLYRYRCDNCETTEERNAKIKDKDRQVCRTCLEPLRSLICFQGSVWSPTANGGFK